MWAFLSYMRIQSTAGVVVNFINSMCKKEVPYSVDTYWHYVCNK